MGSAFDFGPGEPSLISKVCVTLSYLYVIHRRLTYMLSVCYTQAAYLYLYVIHRRLTYSYLYVIHRRLTYSYLYVIHRRLTFELSVCYTQAAYLHRRLTCMLYTGGLPIE